MAEASQTKTGVGTLGLILQGPGGKLYATTSSHNVRLAQNVFKCKTISNEEIEIGNLNKLKKIVETDEYLDKVDVFEITNQTFCFKSGFPNSEGIRCEAFISRLTSRELLGKSVYHISINGDKKKIIRGTIVDIENAGDDHYFVLGFGKFGKETFATKGNSGGIVAMETENKGKVELVGMITSGELNYYKPENNDERMFCRCLLLSKAEEHLNEKYGPFKLLDFKESDSAELESGMTIYFPITTTK